MRFGAPASAYDTIVSDGVFAVTVRSGSTVVLADLSVTVDSECGACLYSFAGAFITITSGTYSNVTTTPYRYLPQWTGRAVDQHNVAQKLVNITGGSFSQVNPADGDDAHTGTDAASATFVDPGCVSVLEDGAYVVYEAVTVTFCSWAFSSSVSVGTMPVIIWRKPSGSGSPSRR